MDYLELRSLGDRSVATGCVVDSVGTQCSGAADPATCQRAVATLTPSWGFIDPMVYSLFTTTGDRVQSLSVDRVTIPALLAPIDSEWEAVLVARVTAFQVDCTAPMDQVVHAVPGGYEIIATTGNACGPGQDVYRHTLLVSAEGNISTQKSELIKPTVQNCIVD